MCIYILTEVDYLKVKDLIEKLQPFDPNFEVKAEIGYKENADIETLEIVPDWDFSEGKPVETKTVLLCTDWSSALPYADDTEYQV